MKKSCHVENELMQCVDRANVSRMTQNRMDIIIKEAN